MADTASSPMLLSPIERDVSCESRSAIARVPASPTWLPLMERDVSCESRSAIARGAGVADLVVPDVEGRQLREPLSNRAGIFNREAQANEG